MRLISTANVSDELPVNEAFLTSVTVAIEDRSVEERHAPSRFYSPSGLNCIRQMYFKRTGAMQDTIPDNYGDITMADTGTRRHEAIQQVLIWMTKHNSRFLYIDVAEYVKQKQARGHLNNLVVTGTYGAETQLLDKFRNIQFRVDGIIYDRNTHKFYLFEFKNQISFKAAGKKHVDLAHHNQVITYCALLGLDQALVVYENRDSGELYCPEVFQVDEYAKHRLMSRIDECEQFVKSSTCPSKPDNISAAECRWCRYKKACKAADKE